jgi:hypothetical protein
VTHNFSKYVLFSACAAVLSISTAAADTCISGDTLAQFEALGSAGCTVGDKTFYDFGYSGSATGGATAVAAGSVIVNTVGPTGEEFAGPDYGLEFQGAWTDTASGETNDGQIQFDVSVNATNVAITDAGVAQSSGVGPGSGSASVAEQVCQGVPCDLTTWAVLTLEEGSLDQTASDTIISPSGAVTVSKDIEVNSGTSAFASISSVTDTFSQTAVPEPRALSLLLALGLVAGFAFRKKFQGAKA